MFLKSAYLRTKGTIRLHSENPEDEGLGATPVSGGLWTEDER